MLRGDLYSFLTSCLILCLSSVHGEVCLESSLPNFQHDIAGRLCFIDQTTLVIRGFRYDGRGPAAYLYYYDTDSGYRASNIPRDGRGDEIPHPETSGRLPTDRVRGEDLQFTLPEGVYACDMAVFTIWCRAANVHFTAIDIPQDIFTTSATDSDRILCTQEPTDGPDEPSGGRPTTDDFENCKQLDDSLSLSWTVDRSSESVEFMLCGCTSADIEQDNTWLGFGLSGSTSGTQMFGADATIVWVDEEDGPQAEDYFLSAYSQCRDGVGACPDSVDSSGDCSKDMTLVQGFREDGQQCVVFSRNFSAGDRCDLPLDPDNENQYIVWGVGGLGETAFRHFIRAERRDPPLHLGRAGSSDCQPLQCSSCDPFQNQRLVAPSSTTFEAHIGPSGDQRGYMAITGRAGWGIAWFINGTLIPELVVQRGQTYKFVVYGGDDPSNNARYHPLYITSSPNGGRAFNTEEQNEEEVVYAGLDEEGEPTGVGPLCEYKSTEEAEGLEDNCDALLCHYEAALMEPAEDCDASVTESNIVTWTPDDDTPDLVYYQCVTHRNLGWKIRVTDSVEDYVDNNPWPAIPSQCPELPDPTTPTGTPTPTLTPTVTPTPTSDTTQPPIPDLEASSESISASYTVLVSFLLMNTLTMLM